MTKKIDTSDVGEYLANAAKDAPVEDLSHLSTDHPDHPYQNGHTDETCAAADIDRTLVERGKRYGEFKDQAVYADKINAVLTSSPNWEKMAPDQREALRIIANKIGRILNGDPNYSDSWHDIVGYAKLVDDRLTGA